MLRVNIIEKSVFLPFSKKICFFFPPTNPLFCYLNLLCATFKVVENIATQTQCGTCWIRWVQKWIQFRKLFSAPLLSRLWKGLQLPGKGKRLFFCVRCSAGLRTTLFVATHCLKTWISTKKRGDKMRNEHNGKSEN